MKAALLIMAVGAVVILTVGCESKEPGHAGAKNARESLEKGLNFLFSNQKANGSIVEQGAEAAALGATGLTVVGAAKAPKDIRAKYEEKIASACKYILSKRMTDGSFQGAEGLPSYTTAISIIALHYTDPQKHKEAIEKGQEYLVNAQYFSEIKADDLNYGGWTYGQEQKGENEPANLSTTHYAVMGLHETGFSRDPEVYRRAVAYVSRCQDNSETSDVTGIKFLNDGGFRYGPRDTRGSENKKGLIDKDGKESFPSYASMTYAGFKTLLYANLAKDDPRVVAALNWMKNNYTLEKNSGMGYRTEEKEMEQQGLYYFYNAFARAMDAWGEKEIEDASGAKHDWAKELTDKLIEKQAGDGSWVNPADRWHECLKTIVTGYSVDALATCIPWLEK